MISLEIFTNEHRNRLSSRSKSIFVHNRADFQETFITVGKDDKKTNYVINNLQYVYNEILFWLPSADVHRF